MKPNQICVITDDPSRSNLSFPKDGTVGITYIALSYNIGAIKGDSFSISIKEVDEKICFESIHENSRKFFSLLRLLDTTVSANLDSVEDFRYFENGLLETRWIFNLGAIWNLRLDFLSQKYDLIYLDLPELDPKALSKKVLIQLFKLKIFASNANFAISDSTMALDPSFGGAYGGGHSSLPSIIRSLISDCHVIYVCRGPRTLVRILFSTLALGLRIVANRYFGWRIESSYDLLYSSGFGLQQISSLRMKEKRPEALLGLLIAGSFFFRKLKAKFFPKNRDFCQEKLFQLLNIPPLKASVLDEPFESLVVPYLMNRLVREWDDYRSFCYAVKSIASALSCSRTTLHLTFENLATLTTADKFEAYGSEVCIYLHGGTVGLYKNFPFLPIYCKGEGSSIKYKVYSKGLSNYIKIRKSGSTKGVDVVCEFKPEFFGKAPRDFVTPSSSNVFVYVMGYHYEHYSSDICFNEFSEFSLTRRLLKLMDIFVEAPKKTLHLMVSGPVPDSTEKIIASYIMDNPNIRRFGGNGLGELPSDATYIIEKLSTTVFRSHIRSAHKLVMMHSLRLEGDLDGLQASGFIPPSTEFYSTTLDLVSRVQQLVSGIESRQNESRVSPSFYIPYFYYTFPGRGHHDIS